MVKMSRQLNETKQISGYELNHNILPNIDLKQFATLKDLVSHLNIDMRDYYFLGNRKHGEPIPLVESSELSSFETLTVVRHEIGG